MYTLLYSKESALEYGSNSAKTNEGPEVRYTCMVNEDEYGSWKDSYKWKDTKVVGHVDSVTQITRYGIRICRLILHAENNSFRHFFEKTT